MKNRGIFAVMAAFVVAGILKAKDIFRTRSSGNCSNRISNGRDAFMAISAPRCHTQKKIYKGFAK
jgi:hypothetical protein